MLPPTGSQCHSARLATVLIGSAAVTVAARPIQPSPLPPTSSPRYGETPIKGVLNRAQTPGSGRNLLNHLILCGEWDEPKTKDASQAALRLLMTHVEDVLALGLLLSNDENEASDVVAERWTAMALFQATLEGGWSTRSPLTPARP